MPLELLHHDEHLVVVNKPPWSVVHPTRGARGAQILVKELGEQLGRPIFPVHRLDRQASGVLVFACSSEVAARLSEDIRESRWDKRYLALCRGVIPDSLRIDHPVREADTNQRRPALTHIDPLEVFCERYTLVHAEPRTGRRHQIRYHLKHVAHPIIGDSNYGQGKINRFFHETFDLERMFLHAERLRLDHPVESRRMEICCPLPAELTRTLERLALHQGPVL